MCGFPCLPRQAGDGRRGLRTFGPSLRVPPGVSYAQAEGQRARHPLAFHCAASEQEKVQR
jgi:hypothetical protein